MTSFETSAAADMTSFETPAAAAQGGEAPAAAAAAAAKAAKKEEVPKFRYNLLEPIMEEESPEARAAAERGEYVPTPTTKWKCTGRQYTTANPDRAAKKAAIRQFTNIYIQEKDSKGLGPIYCYRGERVKINSKLSEHAKAYNLTHRAKIKPVAVVIPQRMLAYEAASAEAAALGLPVPDKAQFMRALAQKKRAAAAAAAAAANSSPPSASGATAASRKRKATTSPASSSPKAAATRAQRQKKQQTKQEGGEGGGTSAAAAVIAGPPPKKRGRKPAAAIVAAAAAKADKAATVLEAKPAPKKRGRKPKAAANPGNPDEGGAQSLPPSGLPQ